ncbi:ATP-grasp domain-containing protein [Streptomyces sp. NPDC002067]
MAPPDGLAGSPVLLLGWNGGRAAAALAAAGSRVVCAVAPSEAPSARAAGETVVVADPADAEAVLAGLARSGRRPRGFAAVAAAHESAVVTAAVLAQLGGAASLPVETALALRDKDVQKRLVRAAGVATARSAVVAASAEVPLTELRFPVVVKPLNGDAGTGADLLRSAAHARTWTYRAACDGPWQVEEFVSGSEVHLDGVVRAGEVTALAVSRYLRNVLDTRDGAPMGSVVADPGRDPALYRDGRALAARAVTALGHREGVFHLEAFRRPDGELVFGECAGRVAGGRIDEAVHRKLGVDLHAQWAAALLGLPGPAAAPAARTEAFGYVLLSAPPGIVDEAPATDDILAREGVVSAERARRTRGARTGRPVAFTAVRAVLTGKDEEQVTRRAEDLAEWFHGWNGAAVRRAGG